jgi:hypothetical protein
MRFDLPAGIERDLERYAKAEHISPAEAAVLLIQSSLKSSKSKAKSNGDLLTDELINQLKALDTSYGLLETCPKRISIAWKPPSGA